MGISSVRSADHLNAMKITIRIDREATALASNLVANYEDFNYSTLGSDHVFELRGLDDDDEEFLAITEEVAMELDLDHETIVDRWEIE